MKKLFTRRVLGVDVVISTVQDIANFINDNEEDLRGRFIFLATVDGLLGARRDAAYMQVLRDAVFVLPQSEQVLWDLRLDGFEEADCVTAKRLREHLSDHVRNRITFVRQQDLDDIYSLREYARKSGSLVICVGKASSMTQRARFLALRFFDAGKRESDADNQKKNLLIYAHYYYPDVASTGQILTELAEGLKEFLNVTVICTVPSYTSEVDSYYKKHNYYPENMNGVEVLRVRVPSFRKNYSASRIVNILSYFFSAIMATFRVGKQDYIYTISQPPVLGGLLGVVGKIIKRGKLIYNIQDFNPEQVQAVDFTNNRLVLGTMMGLDMFTCKSASKIIVVGRDMVETLKKRFNGNPPCYVHINNWIDEKATVPLPKDHPRVLAFKEKYGIQDKFVIMYSGNIGLYYDLLEIEKIIETFKDNKDVVFAFVGQGTVLEEMEQYKRANKVGNIVFIPYQPKEDLVYSLNAGDVHFVVNASGIKGVSVPSKLYGVMAVGKPVLGILDEGAEARLIVEEADCGKVVAPGDYAAITDLIQFFINHRDDTEVTAMGDRGRSFLDRNLAREISIKRYAKEIMEL